MNMGESLWECSQGGSVSLFNNSYVVYAFSVVCTLIDNGTRHRNGQILRAHEAPPSESTTNFYQRHWKRVHAYSIVWSLIDDRKLANQIARLGAIVVKTPPTEIVELSVAVFVGSLDYLSGHTQTANSFFKNR